IDLRENGGGEAESMIDTASAFLGAGVGLGEFTNRAGRTVATPQTRRTMLLAAEEIEPFAGRVVVLTSARTASAAEIFVAALRDAGRAVVLGEQTCGCVLAIRERHQLPDGGLLDVSEMDYRTARGARLEGAGVAPDETVTPTRRDIERGRDPALLRAVTILKTMKQGRGMMN
ncbi:MAG: S41 family peptidase, partial [Acidobacteriota bacterium]|nr:S41 family peptidase [Acidobacteriota bacterium]